MSLQKDKPIIINFYGEPGSGKSSASAWANDALQKAGYNSIYVEEFAKDLVFEGKLTASTPQVYIFGNQLQRINEATEKHDIIISDSPLLLSTIYYQNNPLGRDLFNQFVLLVDKEYDATNVLMTRPPHIPYERIGRIQKEEEAALIRERVLSIEEKAGIKFNRFPLDWKENYDAVELLTSFNAELAKKIQK